MIPRALALPQRQTHCGGVWWIGIEGGHLGYEKDLARFGPFLHFYCTRWYPIHLTLSGIVLCILLLLTMSQNEDNAAPQGTQLERGIGIEFLDPERRIKLLQIQMQLVAAAFQKHGVASFHFSAVQLRAAMSLLDGCRETDPTSTSKDPNRTRRHGLRSTYIQCRRDHCRRQPCIRHHT
jgi:hypothetical protein